MSGPITPPLTVTTSGDGTPSGRPITTIKVSDGDLTISGNVATIDTSGTATTPGGSDTQVQFNDGGAFGGDNGFTYTKATEKVKVGNASIVTSNAGKVSVVQESADTGAAMYLQKDEDGAGSGPNLVFYRNSASPANDDAIGRLGFNGEDSIGGERTYARITGEIEDVTSGANDGRIVVETIKAGTQTEQIQIDSAGIKFNNAYTFPTADGNANQVLTTNGAGAITFEDGGGSGGFPTLMIDYGGESDDYAVSAMTPYGAQGASSQSMGIDEPQFFPIISPVTGTLSRMSIKVNSASAGENILIGVYSEDTSWYGPDTLLGSATISLASSGDVSQTSFSSTISMTAATKYWIGYVCDTASSSASVWGLNNNYTPQFGGATSSVTGTKPSWRLNAGSSDQALPSSVADASSGFLDTGKRLALGMKW